MIELYFLLGVGLFYLIGAIADSYTTYIGLTRYSPNFYETNNTLVSLMNKFGMVPVLIGKIFLFPLIIAAVLLVSYYNGFYHPILAISGSFGLFLIGVFWGYLGYNNLQIINKIKNR